MSRSAQGVSVVVAGSASALGRRLHDGLAAAGIASVEVGDSAYVAETAVFVEARCAEYDSISALGTSPAVAVAAALDVADRDNIEHFVLLSSAMVYGAYQNNPVPLTEHTVLRPPDEFVYARQLAAAEELVERWRLAGPTRTATVLRLAVPVSQHHSSSLARALTAGIGQTYGHLDPPAQFVHLDDVVSAAVLAVELRLDGVFNVAPDGWIPGDRLWALAGHRLRIPLPGPVAEVAAALRWRFQRGPIQPGLAPYTAQPWVVANDKLRAYGWVPRVSNEEAFVEATEAPWWSTVTPKRRQELALGVLGALVALGAAALVGLLLSVRRRR